MIRKRSIAIAGHRTSISLEDAFWQAAQDIAAARGMTLPALVAEIDSTRAPEVNLSSAIRVAVLDWYRLGAASR
ncbi:ribbon-helix-helix domain-containing protein [Mesorhizobium sp. BR1-1-16]|uniref:ribbon-helix-helix domain-containing protein n=1 Tax=Mesorhizobium sp. BR1-1-16 TaxID=2876653 RepID=UPI001CCE43D3|nr:ribbon-helix-helix domain-containing protein [Mesorhizobium sp. BR1-1-16]MBZ9937669.1 ribbon-helix-helix domain-containing protein [Mesorhizobium sp. BR1-1-16]